jgi:hypothetical protein
MDASAVYRESFVWDDHCGFELLPDAPLDPLLAPWREAGVDYLSINVAYDLQPWSQAMENIAALRRRLPIEAPYCRIVASVGDVDLARAAGKIAVTFETRSMAGSIWCSFTTRLACATCSLPITATIWPAPAAMTRTPASPTSGAR